VRLPFFSFINSYICVMRRIVILFLMLTAVLRAQTNDTVKSAKYLEDQIYIGLSMITLTNLDDYIAQSGFSNSFSFGFIKDIPVNLKGNFAFGLGIGYGGNTYFQNIKITEQDNISYYEIAGADVTKNKFSFQTIDFPIEIRLRTSTLDKYKFWRLYAGGKIGYVVSSSAKFREDGNSTKIKGISELNKWQYGLSLAVGYGTWNFNFYYGLSDIFSNAKLNGVKPIEIKDIRIGLIFYIL
jgi:hypothetical protein